MKNIFCDEEKDTMYEALQECAVDNAKRLGRDELDEDVVLINDFFEDVTRFNFVEKIVDKLREKGYKISKRT